MDLEITLVRHAQSYDNIRLRHSSYDDNSEMGLTDVGLQQAANLHLEIPREFLSSAIVYCSPYLRARETLDILMASHRLFGLPIIEDSLLCEQTKGYLRREDVEKIRQQGRFRYKPEGGESAADCYARITLFMDSMFLNAQKLQRSKIFVMCHGMIIRYFVMQFLKLSESDFNRMKTPGNCDVIRIAKTSNIDDASFMAGGYAVFGMRFRRCYSD